MVRIPAGIQLGGADTLVLSNDSGTSGYPVGLCIHTSTQQMALVPNYSVGQQIYQYSALYPGTELVRTNIPSKWFSYQASTQH